MPSDNLSFLLPLILMQYFTFSLYEEGDKEWNGRDTTQSPSFEIAPMALISPETGGAYTIFRKWRDNIVYTWLAAQRGVHGHDATHMLEEDGGEPMVAMPQVNPPAPVSTGATTAVKQEKEGEEKEEDEDQRPSETPSKTVKSSVSRDLKRQVRVQKIQERKYSQWVANQQEFYSYIWRSLANNPKAQAKIEAVPVSSPARGTLAMQALESWILYDEKLDKVKDKKKYYTTCARSLRQQFPDNSPPVAVGPSALEDLQVRLEMLDSFITDFVKQFADEDDADAVRHGYLPEQDMIEMLRVLLPDSMEWNMIRVQIDDGEAHGSTYEGALAYVKKSIRALIPRSNKLAVHDLPGSSNSSVVANPLHSQSEEAENDRTARLPKDDGTPAKCMTPGCPSPDGHRSTWWRCPVYHQWKANKSIRRQQDKDRKKQDKSRGNQPGGKGGGKGGGGKGGGRNRDRGKGGGKGQGQGAGKSNGGRKSKGGCNICHDPDHYVVDCPHNSKSANFDIKSATAAPVQAQQQQSAPPPPQQYPTDWQTQSYPMSQHTQMSQQPQGWGVPPANSVPINAGVPQQHGMLQQWQRSDPHLALQMQTTERRIAHDDAVRRQSQLQSQSQWSNSSAGSGAGARGQRYGMPMVAINQSSLFGTAGTAPSLAGARAGGMMLAGTERAREFMSTVSPHRQEPTQSSAAPYRHDSGAGAGAGAPYRQEPTQPSAAPYRHDPGAGAGAGANSNTTGQGSVGGQAPYQRRSNRRGSDFY